jgi:hypothetical protein
MAALKPPGPLGGPGRPPPFMPGEGAQGAGMLPGRGDEDGAGRDWKAGADGRGADDVDPP